MPSWIGAGRVFALAVFVDRDRAARGIGRRFAARLHQIGGIVDHGGEIALAGAAEIPVRTGSRCRRGSGTGPRSCGHSPQGPAVGDQLGVIDLDAGERGARRPIGAHVDGVARHAGGGENRMDFAHRIGGGAVGRPAVRHVDDDAAGGFAPPQLREGQHVGALARRQPAAIAAEEDFDGALAFLQRDRMAFAIVGRDRALAARRAAS